jgi:hypothetical protein
LRNDSGGLELISALAVVILGLVIGGRLAIQKTAAGLILFLSEPSL